MTILNPSKIIKHSQKHLWDMIAEFPKTSQWLQGVEKVEYRSGSEKGVGSVWRFYFNTSAEILLFDFEITEWIEGERFGVRPVRATGVYKGIQLFQIVFDLKRVSDDETKVSIQFEYEPVSKLGRLKNLTFLRKQYLDFAEQSINKLSQITTSGSSLPN